MELKCTPLGPIGANCYQLEKNRKISLIDPGHEEESFVESMNDKNIPYILLTHGHYDHTGAVKRLKMEHPEAKIYIHEGDAQGAGSRLYPLVGEVEDLNYFHEGQVIDFEGSEILVHETPGHSLGSVCLEVEGHLFSGDTLFAGSMGRVDLPGGDYKIIMDSLKRLSKLDKKLEVHPGHGESSLLLIEMQTNPYLREAMGTY